MKFVLQRVVSLAAVLACAATASAQIIPTVPDRPGRPYRGLFAGGVSNAEQLLTVTGSVGGGWSTDVLAEPGTPVDPRFQEPGGFGSASGSISYGYNRERWSAGLSASTSMRLRPDVADDVEMGYSAGAGVSSQLWRNASVTVSQSVTYQPYYVLSLFPTLATDELGQTTVGNPELAALNTKYLNLSTSVGLAQRVSARGSLSVSYGYQMSDFEGTNSDYRSQSAGAGYSYAIGKGLSLRMGYNYQDFEYPDRLEPVQGRSHWIDAGVDFNRALSISRKTTLSFSTGTAAYTDAETETTRYDFTGSAQLMRELGRSWTAAAGYHRGLQFVPGIPDPYMTDGAAVSIGGLVTRRIQFGAQAGVSWGHSYGDTGDVDNYAGVVGASYAITRHLSLGATYSYYRYEYEQGRPIPEGYAPKVDRHSVGVFLSAWAPIFHKARRPDASR